jgi:hypothetical protein
MKAGLVVLRESSLVLGSLASGALSPMEARRVGRITRARSGGWGRYPFPFPGACRGRPGNASRETVVRA